MPTNAPVWEDTEDVESWDSTLSEQEFLDEGLRAGGLKLAAPVQPPSPEMLTTYGGPPKPLASFSETTQEAADAMMAPRINVPRIPIIEGDPWYKTVPKQAVNVALGVPEFLTSNVGLLAAAAAPAAPIATAGAFTADMLKSLYQQGKTAYKNWDQMTPTQRQVALTDMAGTGAFAALVGTHAGRGIADKVVPARALAKQIREAPFQPGEIIAPEALQMGGQRIAPPEGMVTAQTAKWQPGGKPKQEPSAPEPPPTPPSPSPEPPASPTAPKPPDAPAAAATAPSEMFNGKPVILLTGPDGRTYRATYDGDFDFGKGPIAAITPLEDLPGSKGKGSSTVGPALEKAGYKLPPKMPEAPVQKPFVPRPPKPQPSPAPDAAPKPAKYYGSVRGVHSFNLLDDIKDPKTGEVLHTKDSNVSLGTLEKYGIPHEPVPEAVPEPAAPKPIQSEAGGELKSLADLAAEPGTKGRPAKLARLRRMVGNVDKKIDALVEAGDTGEALDMAETQRAKLVKIMEREEKSALAEAWGETGQEGQKEGLQVAPPAEPAAAPDLQGAPPSLASQPMTPAPAPTAPVLPPKAISQIIRDLSKGLNIPIRFGRLMTPKYGGYFVKAWNLIATKRPNEMPIVSHEVGHKLDAAFNLSSNGAIVAELHVLGDPATPGSMSSWTKSKTIPYKMGEGVAEFTRHWLIDPAHARTAAPNTFTAFEAALGSNKDFGAVMRQAQYDIKLWREAPNQARLHSSISTSNPIPAHYSLDNLVRDVVDDLHFTRLMTDDAKLGGTVRPSQNVYQLSRALRGVYGKADAFIRKGIVDFGTGEVSIGSSFYDAMEPVRGRVQDFQDWIVARHAKELQARGIETGLLPVDVQAVLRKFNGDPVFEKAFSDIKRWQEGLLKYATDAGLLSPDAAPKWRQMSEDYVPFHRVMEVGAGETPSQTGSGAGRGLNVGKPGSFKKQTGGKEDIISPLETMVKNAYAIITASDKNAIHIALADTIRKPNMGKWVEKIGAPKELVKVQLERIREQLEAEGADLTNVPDDLLMTFFKPSGRAPFGENAIMVNRSGKQEFYRLNKDLFETFHALDQESAGKLIRMLAGPGQLLRAGVTLTPDFAVFNALRDTVTAAVISRHTVLPFEATIRGIAAMVGNPKLVAEWAASGGKQAIEASYFDRGKLQDFLRERITKDLTKAEQAMIFAKSPLTALRLFTGMLEEATRIGEYQGVFNKLVKKGMSEGDARRQAGFESRDLQDFAKGGAQTKIIRQITPFWNAALQGNVRLYQSIKERPVQTALKGLAFVTIPKMMEQALNWDDPDYWDRPQWERDLFFLLPFGKDDNNRTKFVRIPVPFEVGVIFATLPGRFLQHFKEKQSPAFDGLPGLMLKTTVPNPFPQSVVTVAETMMGKQGFSLWRGRPIVPESLKDQAPELQLTEQTSLTAKHAGELMGVSPIKVDYILQGLTGGLGKQIVNQGVDRVISAVTGEERTATRQGPLGRFITTPAGTQSDAVERFYRLLEKARSDVSRAKHERPTRGFEAKASQLERAAKDMSQLRKEARQTTDPAARQRINLEIAKIAREAIE